MIYQDLFNECYPEIGAYYQELRRRFVNPQKCISVIYHGETDADGKFVNSSLQSLLSIEILEKMLKIHTKPKSLTLAMIVKDVQVDQIMRDYKCCLKQSDDPNRLMGLRDLLNDLRQLLELKRLGILNFSHDAKNCVAEIGKTVEQLIDNLTEREVRDKIGKAVEQLTDNLKEREVQDKIGTVVLNINHLTGNEA